MLLFKVFLLGTEVFFLQVFVASFVKIFLLGTEVFLLGNKCFEQRVLLLKKSVFAYKCYFLKSFPIGVIGSLRVASNTL